jgi:hypothetical protein
MSLAELQRIIDATHAASHMEGLTAEEAGSGSFPEATWAQNLINQSWGVTVATSRDDGTPHAVVTFAVCLDGAIYLAARTGTVLLHNLRARPEVMITCLGEPYDSIMATGAVQSLGKWDELDDDTREAMKAARPDGFVRADWPGYVFRFQPQLLWVR